ncbi:MAG: hypothetical protein WC907_03925 [Acholeplasmataceae bacterium]|jgi:hypothetical protein
MESIEAIFAILGILSAVGFGYIVNDVRYAKGKKILKKIREMIDYVDDAVYDDHVTEEEFRVGWEKLKALYAALMS